MLANDKIPRAYPTRLITELTELTLLTEFVPIYKFHVPLVSFCYGNGRCGRGDVSLYVR